jgi:hypothetical protein
MLKVAKETPVTFRWPRSRVGEDFAARVANNQSPTIKRRDSRSADAELLLEGGER